jgi:hypothetical protein
MITSYSCRMSDYLYDIETDDTTRFVNAERFCARVANIVRLEYGHSVSVNAGLPNTYSSTRHEAVSKIEAALAVWVQARHDGPDETTSIILTHSAGGPRPSICCRQARG